MALLIHSPELSAVKFLFNPIPAGKVSRGLKNGVAVRSIARAGAGTGSKVAERGGEIRVSELNRNVMMYGQFSAPVKEETTRSNEEEEKQNYYVNMGYAIRTLREEFPHIFYRDLSFDIYREDIVFKDPLNTFIGIENYKSVFWALRFHGNLFFKTLSIDIISVWQPVESIIMVRWTVQGVPRVPWESRGRFDGTSEYKLDKHGKIFHHRVHNVALSSPPRFGVLAVEELIQSLSCPSTPKPTYFEASSVCSKR